MDYSFLFGLIDKKVKRYKKHTLHTRNIIELLIFKQVIKPRLHKTICINSITSIKQLTNRSKYVFVIPNCKSE